MSKIDNGWRTGKRGRYNIYWNKNKIKVSKKLYGKLCRIINTYPNKWQEGTNKQIIEDKMVIFKYNGFDDFEIKQVRKYE